MIPVSTFKVEYGCRPGILMVKMGQEGHYRGSRVILSGFYNLGFNVNVGPLFFTPGEVADLATNSDVHVIGVSYQAAGHLSLFPELRDKLRRRRRRRRTRKGGGRTRGTRKKRKGKRRTKIWWWWRGGSYQPGITIFSWEEGRTTAAKRAGAAILYSVPGLELTPPPYKCCFSFATRGEGGDNDLHMISDLDLELDLNLER